MSDRCGVIELVDPIGQVSVSSTYRGVVIFYIELAEKPLMSVND